MCIHDLDSEFEGVKPTNYVDSAQAATAISHKDWRDIKSVDLSVQKSPSSLSSSGGTYEEKLEMNEEKRLKAQRAFYKYHGKGEPRNCDHQTNLMEICQI
jgi:hypothetical protein